MERNGIRILTDYVETSNYEPGVIIEQELLFEGDPIDPKTYNQIRFIIASSIKIQLDDYEGMDINSAKNNLEKLGAQVVLEQLSTDEMDEEELEGIVRNRVVRQDPEPFVWYTQEGESVVTLYYY